MANKKIIRLTEQDLERMVQKIIKESNNYGSIEDYFSKEELAEIKENATRLLLPQFFEDYEVTNYISTVSGNDKKVERMLVNWLKSEGLEFYQPEYRSDTGYFDYMEDETSTPIKPITIHGKTYNFVEDLPIRELGIGSYVIQDGVVMVDGETPLQDFIGHDMDSEPNEDYMSSEEDLINATYDLMYDLGDEDVEILDLRDAANILDEELHEGNHGPVMEEKIEDLLTQIEAVIGYPDDEEGEDIEDHLDYMSSEEELINATYDLLYDLGYDHIEDDYIQSLEDARKALDTELYDNDHGSEMEEKIEALLNKIEEVIYYPDNDEGENIEDHLDYMSGEKDYMEQGFKKPGMFQKLKKQARNLVGVEYDRETLDQIYRMIKMGRVESIRKQNAGLTAWVNGKALIVDRLTPEIIYAGKTLDLVDTDLEVDNLYQKLILNL